MGGVGGEGGGEGEMRNKGRAWGCTNYISFLTKYLLKEMPKTTQKEMKLAIIVVNFDLDSASVKI